MKVINEVKVPNCEQWLAAFVKRIMKKAKIECKEVRVTSLDEKFVYITVDSDESKYKIMINGRIYSIDQNGIPYAVELKYVLLEMKEDRYMDISIGTYKASWENKFEEWFPKDAVERLTWYVLESADVYEEEIEEDDEEIKDYGNNFILVRVKELDYLIQITRFPAVKCNEVGKPIRFKVSYILRKISCDGETNEEYLSDVETGECELCWDDEFEEYYIDKKAWPIAADWYLSILKEKGVKSPESVEVELV